MTETDKMVKDCSLRNESSAPWEIRYTDRQTTSGVGGLAQLHSLTGCIMKVWSSATQ